MVNLKENTPEEVLKEMTLEEKAALTTGGLPYGTASVERLGIPHALTNDSMAGINFRQLFANYVAMETGENILLSLRRCEKILQQLRTQHKIVPEELDEESKIAYEAIKKHLNNHVEKAYQVTSFPAGNLLGATWNPEMAFQCAEALTREFDAFEDDVVITPNINIQRDPLGGRLFESYSEDPYVTAEMGTEFVKGIQAVGLLANPKHFSANNHEKERKGINVHVSERALREIYFPGFEACVKKGKAKTIMSAYNRLNGTACSANRELLTDILRKEWGFEGIVISDWGGVYSPVEAIKAGNDLEMPEIGNRQLIYDALKNGNLSMEELDTVVLRILKALKEMPCIKGHRYSDIDQAYSRRAARTAVQEGIVLLKNNEVLPLTTAAGVNLVGEGVDSLLECGAGSAEVLREKSESLFLCMQKVADKNSIREKENIASTDAEYVLVVGRSSGREGADRESMLLDDPDQEEVTSILREAKQYGKKTILVLNIAGPVDVRAYEQDADAILCLFIPGCQGAPALTDVLYGKVNPSGKLAITFPKKYVDCPTYGNFPGYNAQVWYGEGIYVGYRYYDIKEIEPQYPFGYGLSYTNFQIHDLKLEKKSFSDEKVCFDVAVTNIGKMTGKEVVQVYIHHENPTLQKPYQELKAFRKVEVRPGETVIVHFELAFEDFASFDEKLHAFVVEPGMYLLRVGNSSRGIQQECRIALKGPDPYGYSESTRIASVWADERCRELYLQYFDTYCSIHNYNDLLGYTPDYPVGKAIRERVPEESYSSGEEKEQAIAEFFEKLSRLDLGKTTERAKE